jgi:hypothetical protein
MPRPVRPRPNEAPPADFEPGKGAPSRAAHERSEAASQIEATVEAAQIPERSLVAATDALGVRARRGQWWLPG